MNQIPGKSDPLAGRIVVIRGQRVILDADLARLYGIPTKAFNQATRRNRARFPTDFAFQLTTDDMVNLRSQIVTSSSKASDEKEDKKVRKKERKKVRKEESKKVRKYRINAPL